MNDTAARGPRFSDAAAAEKLVRMLRSMLRRFPRAHLLNTRDAFGASLDDNKWMQVSYSGNWTPEDMRDLLALFATWCVADPARLFVPGVRLDGVLQTARQELEQSASREV